MLIVTDDHRLRAGVCSLDELCPYCGSAFAFYPLIMSDNSTQTVYHSSQQLVGDERQGLLAQHLPRCRIEAVWQEMLQVFVDGSPVTCAIHSHPHFGAFVRDLRRAKVATVVLLAPVVG